MLSVVEAVARTLDPVAFVPADSHYANPQRRLRALRMAEEAVRAYERHVPTLHLANLLVLRSPGEAVPSSRVGSERLERRSCKGCGGRIEPGRAYVVDGPYHVRCGGGG